MSDIAKELAEAQRRLLQGKCVFCTQSDDDGRVMLTNTKTKVSVCEHCVRKLHLALMHHDFLHSVSEEGLTKQ